MFIRHAEENYSIDFHKIGYTHLEQASLNALEWGLKIILFGQNMLRTWFLISYKN